jgi:voltage-gated potassium channel
VIIIEELLKGTIDLVHIYHRFLQWPLVFRILVIALFLISTFGAAAHMVEPKTFPTIFDGVWWAIITASTVGYGDLYPSSTEGRMIGILLILAGAGFLSTYFITLATTAVTTQNAFLEGKATYNGKDHIIIIGWNERSREIIDQLISLDRQCFVILIDDTLKENPYKNHHVHFIKGKAYNDKVLKQANIHHASKGIITADQNQNEEHADMNSILTLLAMKGMKSNLYCVVEILTKDQVANASRAGADEIIQSNKQTSYVVMNSIISQGMSKTILKLLNHLSGNNLKLIPTSPEWCGKNFQELSAFLLKKNIILLGIKKGEYTGVNPPLGTVIHEEDELLVISN